MTRWLLVCAIAAACSHPPPPKPVVAELPVAGAESLAGSWVTADDMDWGYALSIGKDGALALVIDRGKMGRCEAKGALAAGGEAKTFQLSYAKNTCNQDYAGATLVVQVASFTGSSLTLVIKGNGSEERRTYARDPKSAGDR